MSGDEEFEEELARIIGGECDPDSEEGRRAIEASGVAPEELEGLLALSAHMDAAAALREEVELELQKGGEAPGQELLAQQLEELAAADPRPPRALSSAPRLPRRWLWLAAAGLLCLLPALLHWAGEPRGGPEEVLGGQVRLRVEAGAQGEYGPVHFEPSTLEGIPELRLQVFDLAEAGAERPRFEYPLLDSPWFDPAEQSEWPPAVLLKIVGRVDGRSTEPLGWLEHSR